MTEVIRPATDHGTIFWGEVAPCEHFLQLYDNDETFLDSLEGFVAGGLRSGDATIVIATNPHRIGLESRLRQRGIDIDAARSTNSYIDLDAHETLSKFIADEWPEDESFARVIGEILTLARAEGRHVRAFGEMVAILWAEGASAATVRLEYLWHQLCQAEGFSLLCAYPKIGFTEDMNSSLEQIRAAHSRLVGADHASLVQ